MADAIALPAFGYRYIPGPFQYSGGVAALPGHAIERIRFFEPVPLDEGFKRIEQYLAERGLKPTAFCACELRSPAPFTDDGFRAFNRGYVGTLERWGIVKGDANPVARRSPMSASAVARKSPSRHAAPGMESSAVALTDVAPATAARLMSRRPGSTAWP